MRRLLLIIVLLASSFAEAQFESKAIADAKKYFPGYSSYEYSHKKQKIEGLRYYYRCNVDAYKSAGFKCYPSAKQRKGLWVEYWSNGAFKDKGTWIGTRYTNVPNPKQAPLLAALEESFDPIAFFESAWLWDLLEIHSYELEPTMTGQYEPYWSSEQEVMVNGFVTASVMRGCCEVEKIKFTGIFKFKSTDCGKSFTFVDGYKKPSMYSTESLGKTSYAQAEGLELQKKTIGRAHAEKKAEEEWNALAPLTIPEFDNGQKFALFAYQKMVTGSEDEVKSLLYRTLPSYRFMEGSQYLLNWSTAETMTKYMDQITANNGTNVQSNFCEVVNRYQNTKSTYTFHDKGEDSHMDIIVEKENGQWKIRELKIWLSDDVKTKDCPPIVEMETVKNEEYGFSIDMPKGYEITKRDNAVIYEVKINNVKYTVAASNFGDGKSNANRAKTADDNRHRHVMDIHSTQEEYSDWTLNGVTGKEAFFIANNKHYERYRTIWLGDYYYEFWIFGLNFTEQNDQFFESFKATGKGGGSREGLAFKAGDPVEIHIGANRYEKGNITEVLADNQYTVYVKNQNKSYTASIDALRADADGKSMEVPEKTEAPSSYAKGDRVLVRTGQTTWEKAVVVEKRADGKYHVKMDNGDQYYQPLKNLKPDPDAASTEKKNNNVKGRLNGLKGRL